jgi:hypothetical protein
MEDFDLFKFVVDESINDALPPVPKVSALTDSSNPQIGSSLTAPIVPLTTSPANQQPPILPLMTFPLAGNPQPSLLGASGSANPQPGGIYTPSLLGASGSTNPQQIAPLLSFSPGGNPQPGGIYTPSLLGNPQLDTQKPPQTPQFFPATPPLDIPANPQQPSTPKILPPAPPAPLKLATPSTPSASAAPSKPPLSSTPSKKVVPSKPPLSSTPAKSGTPSTPANPLKPPAPSTPGASATPSKPAKPSTPVVPAQPTIFDESFDLGADEVGMMGPYQWTRQTAVAPTFAAGSGNNQLNLSTHRRIHYELLMMKLQHLS